MLGQIKFNESLDALALNTELLLAG